MIQAQTSTELINACDLCFVLSKDESGNLSRCCVFVVAAMLTLRTVKVQYAVGDGLSIGCPCCAVHYCKVNLAFKRDIYCPEHAHLAQQCAIIGCNLPSLRVPPTQMCTLEAHQAVERAYHSDANCASHKLRARLPNNGVSLAV